MNILTKGTNREFTSDFLGEIGRHQLLTPEKELTMGRKVQEMVVLINRCQNAGKGSACEYSEAEKKKIKIGEKAKNEMIRKSRLVVNLAKRYQERV